ncbi:MAG: hypothetical protein RBT82_13370, partial [Desulfomonilia bacterium]|nr:hypothetical protein [Desulfomonilia bacterium]
MEEWKRYVELSMIDDCVTLIPVKDPERKICELDFNFRYPQNVKRIYVSVDLAQYKVIGLKRAVTPAEKREARGLVPSMVTLKSRELPLLMKALENQPYSIEGRRYN